jgi:hypothetical protein
MVVSAAVARAQSAGWGARAAGPGFIRGSAGHVGSCQGAGMQLPLEPGQACCRAVQKWSGSHESGPWRRRVPRVAAGVAAHRSSGGVKGTNACRSGSSVGLLPPGLGRCRAAAQARDGAGREGWRYPSVGVAIRGHTRGLLRLRARIHDFHPMQSSQPWVLPPHPLWGQLLPFPAAPLITPGPPPKPTCMTPPRGHAGTCLSRQAAA